MLQERRSTGEVLCRTEAPSVARLPTGVEEGAGEGACTAPEEATCTPAAAGAEQDRRPTSDPACREAAAERIIFPTRSTEATCVHYFFSLLFTFPGHFLINVVEITEGKLKQEKI